MHELQKHFDIFALNNQLNGEEKNFNLDLVMDALPSPNIIPEGSEKSHRQSCSAYSKRTQKPKPKREKKFIYDDGTHFLKETHYKGQPLIYEK